MKIFSLTKKIFSPAAWRRRRLRIASDRRAAREAESWKKWLAANQTTTAARANWRDEINAFSHQPLISIVTPVYNVEERWLRRCVESVLEQVYENWELCLADDCSTLPHIRKVLEEYAARDRRVKTIFRETNGHISAASNSALELATGEYAALLDNDDELAQDALFRIAEEINRFPTAAMIYSDEDTISETGARYDPKFKPDWSRDYFYSVNYTNHLTVYRTEILRRIGGWRVGFEGSQDYDLALRFVEEIDEADIRHIPRILYHWRAVGGSIALSDEAKPYAHERARQAIREHLERTGKSATVSATANNLHRVRYDLPKPLPSAVLILTAEENHAGVLKRLKNYVEQTAYENLEIVLVAGKNIESKFVAAHFPASVKFLPGGESSEAEKLNRAAKETEAEILCFADINLQPVSANWLEELIGFASQKEIGAVGGKITGADELILESGLIIGGEKRLVAAAHRGFADEEFVNVRRLQLIGNYSAMSVSCLATRRETFLENDGFDETNLPNRFFDADFCLRLREKNYRIVFTPYAGLIEVNRKWRLNREKKPTAAENDYFADKWKNYIERDPFYNPNLSKKNESFSIDV